MATNETKISEEMVRDAARELFGIRPYGIIWDDHYIAARKHLEQISTLKAELGAAGETIVGLMKEREQVKADALHYITCVHHNDEERKPHYHCPICLTKTVANLTAQIATLQDEKDGMVRTNSALLNKLGDLVDALQPFGSGIDFIPWGMIKARLSTEDAKRITQFNYAADQALASTQPSPRGVKFGRMEKALVSLQESATDGIVKDFGLNPRHVKEVVDKALA